MTPKSMTVVLQDGSVWLATQFESVTPKQAMEVHVAPGETVEVIADTAAPAEAAAPADTTAAADEAAA